MELWVRSQDKMLLRKPEQLGIYEGNEAWFIGESLLIDYGKYKSKERALEVLDEIQRRLITLCDSMNRKLYVYEMPKE